MKPVRTLAAALAALILPSIGPARARASEGANEGASAAGATAGEKHEEWKAPEDARKTASPLKADAATLAAGKKVYTDRCVMCHGEKGKGDGKAVPYLKEKPADLSSEDVQMETDGGMMWKVKSGRKPMPSFADKLKDEEIWQVVAFVRSLAAESVSKAPAGDKK